VVDRVCAESDMFVNLTTEKAGTSTCFLIRAIGWFEKE